MKKPFIITLFIAFFFIIATYSLNQKPNVIPSNELSQLNKETAVIEQSSDATIATQPVVGKHNKPSIHNRTLTEPLNSIERLRQITEKTDLQAEVVKEHDAFHRYPPENRSFETEQQDPVKQRYDVDERTTLNQNSHVGMTIWSNEKYYLLGDTVQVYAFLQDTEGNKLKENFIASVYFNEKQFLTNLILNDEDNDGVYQGAFPLSQSSTLGLGPGIYKIRIQNVKNKITDSLTFTLSQPDIMLTGNYKEHINENGDLIIQSEVDIASNNYFYIQASLYSSTHVPIGITQSNQQLSKGTHWIDLRFSGLMIKDAKEIGPYVLKKVSVAKVTMPMQRAPLIEPDFYTDSYSLAEFN